MSQRQANIRLDEEVYERLETAAFLSRATVPEALRTAVLEWLDGFDEEVLEEGERLRELVTPKPESPSASVSSLEKRRRNRGGRK